MMDARDKWIERLDPKLWVITAPMPAFRVLYIARSEEADPVG
jgi:hypothetical protein